MQQHCSQGNRHKHPCKTVASGQHSRASPPGPLSLHSSRARTCQIASPSCKASLGRRSCWCLPRGCLHFCCELNCSGNSATGCMQDSSKLCRLHGSTGTPSISTRKAAKRISVQRTLASWPSFNRRHKVARSMNPLYVMMSCPSLTRGSKVSAWISCIAAGSNTAHKDIS